MDDIENVQLTKEQAVMELLALLRQNRQKECANEVFEAAAYIDSMEKKLDAVVQELVTVREQLQKMEEQKAEQGLKRTITRAVEKLEQDCHVMKEKLSAIQTEFKEKAGEIVAEVKAKGMKALNKVSEFFGVKEALLQFKSTIQSSLEETEHTIAKIDAFGMGMREAARKAANAIRTFADKPEKEYGDKKFSKTEFVKTPFEVKRKLLSGIVSCANGAIESCEKLSKEVLQKEKEKQAERTLFQEEERQSGLVAEPTYKYGAEAFEARQEEVVKAMNEHVTGKTMPVMVEKNGKKIFP